MKLFLIRVSYYTTLGHCVVRFQQLEPLPSPSVAEAPWNTADFAGEGSS